ncbi:MAG: hypothetical protein K6C94_09950 [Candidatus Gastranaerophilales bacterium]|nr:hypothetical protein [Candidatus Gastranaerophilales bacterium]
MSKKILINVYDYENLEDLLKNLQKISDFEVFAAETSFEQIKKYCSDVKKFDWQKDVFDIVICNFYPLRQYRNKNVDEKEILEHFDTEGLSIIQKSAKNYENTLVVTSSAQYEETENYAKNGFVDENLRKTFAQKALLTICQINSDIINITGGQNDFININSVKTDSLAYGENPHQQANLFENDMLSYEIIANRQLSYNNFLDINAATALAAEFYDVNATIIARHAMPCAVALGSSLEESYLKATDCDPVSAFGGVAAFTKIIDKKTAKLLSSMFMEVIIAPDFDEEALEMLKEKNLKLIKINTPLKDYKQFLQKEIMQTPFGILVQDFDNSELMKNTFKVATKKKPTTEMVEDMVFAWKISKHARSNSAIVVKDLKTVGIAQGQANRIEAIDLALDRACENSKDAILATDGFIATTDGILDAAQARIAAIIQPGGSKRDKEIFAAADKNGITMITTGLRQFRNK